MAGRTGFFLSRFRELALVRRRMAVDAEVLGRARELIDLLALDLVTALAREFHVRARQRKTRLRVEGRIGGDLPLHTLNVPAVGRMALSADDALELLMEGFRVRRPMTGLTGLRRNRFKEIGTQGIGPGLEARPAKRFVAVKASILPVLTRDGETSLCVVIEP